MLECRKLTEVLSTQGVALNCFILFIDRLLLFILFNKLVLVLHTYKFYVQWRLLNITLTLVNEIFYIKNQILPKLMIKHKYSLGADTGGFLPSYATREQYYIIVYIKLYHRTYYDTYITLK